MHILPDGHLYFTSARTRSQLAEIRCWIDFECSKRLHEPGNLNVAETVEQCPVLAIVCSGRSTASMFPVYFRVRISERECRRARCLAAVRERAPALFC